MIYTCIIPCYNSEKTIFEVVKLLKNYFEENKFGELEIILVNDHSKDQTVDVINSIVQSHTNVIGIDLAKNTGQHNALLAGMSKASGDYIISLDDDLQTHPSQIGKLIMKVNEGYDVVYGSYEKMKQSTFRNFGRVFNDFTVRKLIGKPKGLEASSFWIAKKFVKDEIIKGKSSFTNLQGLFLRTTKNITNVEIEHFSRKYGSSNYTLKKLIRLWASCLNYSYFPIRLTLIIGPLLLLISCILYFILFLLFLKKTNLDFSFYILINTMFFLASIILAFLGIIGEYIGRMFMVITDEPQFVVKKIIKSK